MSVDITLDRAVMLFFSDGVHYSYHGNSGYIREYSSTL